MCGINGISWSDKDIVRKMNAAIYHRGPDDNGLYYDELLTLGHLRLSIIDLSSAGHQPMASVDKKHLIIFNGEIYNYLDIKDKLIKKGYHFFSKTDTEVILNAYIEWGEKCVNLLHGMWSFCIYDKVGKKLFLSRDRFGIKPLYYIDTGKQFAFSSEIKGLWPTKLIRREANEEMIFRYLYHAEDYHPVETFFKNVKKIPPAHSAIYDLITNKLTIKKYWELNLAQKTGDNLKKRISKIKHLINKSVKSHMIADVEVGCCLSGGLDSTSVICMMDKMKSRKTHAFSIIFKNTDVDESKYTEEVVKKTKVKYHQSTPTIRSLLNDIHDLIETQEEPFTSTSIYAEYKLMQLINTKKIKVVLDGQGGDEIFGGYHEFFAYNFIGLFCRGDLLHLGNELFKYLKLYRNNYAIKYLFNLIQPKIIKDYFDKYTNERKLIKEKFYLKYKQIRRQLGHAKNLSTGMHERMTYRMPAYFRYEDKDSMRYSIESRQPLLDTALVEYLYSCPDKDKINNGITKYILRKAMRRTIPEKIYHRIDKIGFATPENNWFRSSLMIKFFKNTINDKKSIIRKFINENVFNDILSRYIKGESEYRLLIWRCVNLELWIKKQKQITN